MSIFTGPRHVVITILVWTVLVSLSAYFYFSSEKSKTIALAKNEALASFNKDQAFRLWATKHGGVYVPVTNETPANPYLNHLIERDIDTPSGKKLTLMNPAYILRQVMTEYEELYNVRGKITSLKPLNPINEPDTWERKALVDFDQGAKEAVEILEEDGEQFLRLIRPMVTTKGCLKCHAKQGYKEGDIRGGVSLSVPMKAYLEIESETIRYILLTHAFFWLLGSIVIGFIFIRSKLRLIERKEAETRILKLNEELETKVQSRTYELNEEKERAQKYLNVARVMLVVLNDVGEITLINQRGCEILNVKEEDAIGKNWFENFLPKEIIEEVKGVYNKLMAGDIQPFEYYENPIINSNGELRIIAFHNTILKDNYGKIIGILFSGEDVTERKKALEQVKTLSGFLPICASCKKIRDDKGYWNQIEKYIRDHSEAEFSHGVCPECAQKLYPDVELYKK